MLKELKVAAQHLDKPVNAKPNLLYDCVLIYLRAHYSFFNIRNISTEKNHDVFHTYYILYIRAATIKCFWTRVHGHIYVC